MKVVEDVPESGSAGISAGTSGGGRGSAGDCARRLPALPEDQREALLMKYWQDLEYEEMSKRTGVSEEALYQRVCRGLKRLREVLSEKP
jgi:DNA-directed RNA polymerase specialized sigma24 family protein